MHIAVVNLTRGHLSGGYRRYLQNILPLMQQHPSISHLDTYVPIAAGLRFQEVALSEFDPRPLGIEVLKRRLASTNPDVVFIPTASWIDSPSPTVCMVRNMLPLVAPFSEPSPRMIAANLLGRHNVRKILGAADRVIAVSHFVYETLVRQWRAAPAKLGVVPHGVTSLGLGAHDDAPRGVAAFTHTGFLFSAGSLYSYRGFQDLIRAAAILQRDGRGLPILLAGAPNRADQNSYEKRMTRWISSLGLDDRIHWLGNLTAAEMGWCYRQCSVFVSTSRVEACPNTVLEALAHGCLIVSTDAAPMPEFLRDSAFFYTGGSAQSLAGALAKAIELSKADKDLLRRTALERARLYSWDACVTKTVEQLRLAHVAGARNS